LTKLSEIPFRSIKVGMQFNHSHHGEQIILDIDRNNYGPVIKFHNCDIYSGRMPEIINEEENIFQLLAKSTYPSGAEQWEYLGMVTPEQMASHDWQWFEVACPHCGSLHHQIASKPLPGHRQCLVCGMVNSRPVQPSISP
jgi:hypothetical protein